MSENNNQIKTTLEQQLKIVSEEANILRELLFPYERHIKTLCKSNLREMNLTELFRISQLIVEFKRQLKEEQ
jgi:hypothetical protein